METAVYTGKILTDGHLSLPEQIARKLDLRSNDHVQVILVKSPEALNTEEDITYLSNEEILKLSEERAKTLETLCRPQLIHQHKQLITAIREETKRKGTLIGDYDEG